MVLSQIILQSAVIISPVMVVSYFVVKNLKQLRDSKRNPFQDSDLKRFPGQSLLEKIDEINEDINVDVAGLVATPVLSALCYFLQIEKIQTNWYSYAILVTFSTLGTLYFGNRCIKAFTRWRNYKLGYQGELYVAQKLEPLLSKGYKLFHDIHFDNFNIDHVIMGSTGVYVVETKTKRKSKGDPKGHKVTYDGKRLNFPDGSFDANALTQVTRNADTLRKILKEETGEQIPVYPLLTYPGWMITRPPRTDSNGINLVNPKELPASLSFFKDANLSEEQLKLINLTLANLSSPR